MSELPRPDWLTAVQVGLNPVALPLKRKPIFILL